jgi:hypothetical protein
MTRLRWRFRLWWLDARMAMAQALIESVRIELNHDAWNAAREVKKP